MLPWEPLAGALSCRAREHTASTQAAERRAAYQAWALEAIRLFVDQLEVDLTARLGTFDGPTRSNLTHTRHRIPQGVGFGEVLTIGLAGDEVHIHAQWCAGQSPTVHLLWSRKRQQRFCQLVPLSVGHLVPLGDLEGHRLEGLPDGSSHEHTREHLLYRALSLLSSRLG